MGMVFAALDGFNLRRRETPHMIRSEKLGLEVSNNNEVHDLVHCSCGAHGGSAC